MAPARPMWGFQRARVSPASMRPFEPGLGTLLRSGEVAERSEGAACRRRLEAVRALPVRPFNPGLGTLLRSGEVAERSEGAACRRRLEAVRALPVRPFNPGLGTLLRSGEVSERSKERDWKSRTGRKVRRGFKSRPLRLA